VRTIGFFFALGGCIVMAACASSFDAGGVGSSEAEVQVTSTPGVAVWARAFGDDATQHANDVAVDPTTSGEVMVGGFDGSITFGGATFTTGTTYFNAFIASFDSYGRHTWSKAFGNGSGNTNMYSVAGDLAGNVDVTGVFNGTVDFGGGPMTSTGNIGDGFVAQLGPDGSLRWAIHSDAWTSTVATDPRNGDLLVSMGNAPYQGWSIAGCSAPAMREPGWIALFDASGACHGVTTFENGPTNDLAKEKREHRRC
jgi:hypothetical protein